MLQRISYFFWHSESAVVSTSRRLLSSALNEPKVFEPTFDLSAIDSFKEMQEQADSHVFGLLFAGCSPLVD